MPRPWNRIGGWRLKYEPIPIVKRPIDVLNRVLVILMDVFSQDEYNFLRTIATNNSLPVNFDIYYGDGNLLDLLKTNYDRGYRIFISTHGSFALAGIFDWLNSRPDVLVINTTSTLSANYYSKQLGVEVMPYNLIRTAIPDNEMMLTLFKDILFKLPSILKTSEQNELYEPLSLTPENTFPFNNIVYIHITSGYTIGYLQTLTETINTLNLTVELTNLEIIVTEVNGVKTYELPNEAIFYLAYNNIKNDSYSSSIDKPLIILNCEPDVKNELMALFDDILYYDNYTLFSDSFATVFPTAYNFTAGLIHVGNFSRRGFVYSSAVDSTQSISPFVLNIFEILSNCGNFFKIFLNNSFIAKTLIEQLINIQIMQTNSWSDKNLIVSKMLKTSDISTNTSWKWEILFKKQNYNFEEIALITSNNQIIKYPDNISDFTNDLGRIYTFEKNILLNTIACIGSNINTILDNEYIINYFEEYMINYKNFLIQNFNKQLPEILFNHYILFTNVNAYDIPIKVIDPITIDVIVNISDLLDNTKKITVHIPEFSYFVKEYFYDSYNKYYIDKLTSEFKNEATDTLISDGSFNISTILIDTINIISFKGHVVRIGNNMNDSFNTIKTVRGYVQQEINFNYLVIEHDYTVGEKVIVKKCASYNSDGSCNYLNKGIIHDISSNKYYVDISFAVYKDPSTGISSTNVIKYGFTQEEIYPEPPIVDQHGTINLTLNNGLTGLSNSIPNQPTTSVQYDSNGNIIAITVPQPNFT